MLKSQLLEHVMTPLNIGNLDRSLRVLVGASLIGLAAFGVLGSWAYVGVVPLLTGLSAWCPLYSMLGIRTTSR